MSPVALTTLGFRRGDTDDVRAFQAAWNLGPALDVDGIVGTKTTAAIRISADRRRAGKPDASEHFWFRELACHCGRVTCPRIRIQRDLLVGLERLRDAAYPGGLTLVSAYRCPEHNKAVGGASESQHVQGTAADIPPRVPADDVIALRAFSGVGAEGTVGGLVRHVDVRHVAALSNVTHSSPAHPARWAY